MVLDVEEGLVVDGRAGSNQPSPTFHFYWPTRLGGGNRLLQAVGEGSFAANSSLAGPLGQLRATERVDQSFEVVELVEGEA